MTQEIIHRNLKKGTYSSENLTIQGLNSNSKWYDSIHVNICIDVEHGRNHLITSYWCKLLKSVREIITDVNDSQGILVHSSEYE